MQLTSQTRLTLDPAACAHLDSFALFYAKHLHLLYAHIAAHGGKARDHKTEFSRKHGLSARLFNALAVEIQGLIDGTRELLQAKVFDVKKLIKRTQVMLATSDAKLAKVASGKLALTDTAYKKHMEQAGKRRDKLNRLTLNLPRLEARLSANVPGIGFGSRKLFKQQYKLEANGFADHEQWLAAWRSGRAHQISFLGSKDETGGNQTCTLQPKADGTFKLRIRLPDAMLAEGQDKYLWLAGIRFHGDEPSIRAAFAAGQALSYKLHKAKGHWRLLLSFERTEAPKVTREAQWGCVGVDFNADHLAVAETDCYGNIIKAWRIELPFETKSTGQRKAMMSDALQQIANYALLEKKPVVIEDLDFQGKKKQLATMSPAQARMLSGLAYAQYTQLTVSKCHRMGLELLVVDPAYTSVAGRIKYAVPSGRSVHLAAAGVIARRGQGLTEKPPKAKSVRIPANGAIKHFPLPARKAGTSDLRTWVAIGRGLTVFLRKDYLATRPKKPVGAKGGDALGSRARRPRGGTVPPRVTNPMLSESYEQICSLEI
jgi:IS605 OrfB family transposase